MAETPGTVVQDADKEKVAPPVLPTDPSHGSVQTTPTIAPGVGLPLAFKDINFTVPIKKKGQQATTKTILDGISGVCQPGRVLSIMGPSGAGKTSLLDILARRIQMSSGDLCLGSRANASGADIRRYAAYVQQDDAILASQTVREALHMAAMLTLPQSTPKAEKIQRAEQVLRTFQLDSCADTIVGDPVGKLKGISGGERKRTAVAMSAVREPKIFFLDEPTSGLDTYKAYTLIEVLQKLARDNQCTVVCTIHQPSSEIFALFDDLMLLLSGFAVYNGPREGAVPYFASLGFQCPLYANPADYFFMQVVTVKGSVAEGEHLEKLVNSWKQSSEKKATDAIMDTCFANASHKEQAIRPSEMASAITQFQVLLSRGMKDMKRNPMRGKAKLGQTLGFATIITLIWFQVSDDMNGVQDRGGVLFFVCMNGMMSNVLGVLTTFANERGAVIREQENGMYATAPYFFSRMLVDLPALIAIPTLFGSITYWTVGFQADAAKFLIFLMILILIALCSNAMGLFLACIFSDIAVALLIAPLLILPLAMFSGFFLNPESTPVYLKWVEFISPMKYSFSALALNEFKDLPLHCTEDQYRTLAATAPDGTVNIVKMCPYPSGDTYLEQLNIQEELDIFTCALLLAVLGVAFTILAFLGLLRTSRNTTVKAASAKPTA